MSSDIALDCLFKPEVVGVVGASNTEGKVGYTILQNAISCGFSGKVVPINPKESEVQGLKAYPSISAYEGTIDCVVIVIPRKFVMGTVQEAIDNGVKAVSVISAGFKEQDAEGAAMERELADLCRANGVRLLGPNCLGHLNTHHDLSLSFGSQYPDRGGISFISQSGALCTAILDRAKWQHIGMSKLVSMGNKAELTETSFLEALAEDEHTDVIVAYVESIDEGPRFMEVAEAVSRKKPIVVFKSGVTAAGASAASSHTGSLAGADVAYQAAFARTGVVRASTFEQMFEYATAFATQPLPQGRRVTVITNAGGPGIMTTDAIELSGMKMADLSDAARSEMAANLPDAASVKNPVDVLGDALADRYRMAIDTAMEDQNTDAVIVVLTPQAMTDAAGTAQAVIDAKGEKPILCCFMGGIDVAPGVDLLVKNGVPNYTSPERAVGALKAMVDYAEWRAKPVRELPALDVDTAAAKAIIDAHIAAGDLQVNEPNAKAIFRAYGIQVANGKLAPTDEEAGDVAEGIGYPVVMKIVSPDVIHKSDMGGVKLNLKSRDEVIEASRAMKAHILSQLPDADIKGVYVEQMCNMKGASEVIIGMTRDPQFGPMIMCGLGGIFVEVLKDVTFEIAPISKEEARTMLTKIKTYPILEGVRGQAGVDLDILAETLQRVSQLVTDFPQIMEMDINPYIAQSTREESMAADARIRLEA